MKPARFAYDAPDSTADVLSLLRTHGGDAKVLAGGQSLVPLLALRMARFDRLIDLGRVESLQRVAVAGGVLRIGAMVRQAQAEHSPEVELHAPLLARALPLIGHFQIRNMGTIGGSLAHADPSSELPAVALALDARFEIGGPDAAQSSRTVGARDFFQGFWETALAEDELLQSIEFPIWAGRCGFAVEEFSRRAGDFAIAGAAVGITVDDSDAIERSAIACFGLGATSLRADRAEAALLGSTPSAEDMVDIGRLAVADMAPQSDVHGSAEFRREIGAVMVQRALARALEEARHDRR